MLDRKHRLTTDSDFSRLFKRGRSVAVPGLQLRLVRNNLPESRFAFVISLKVSKRAVVRNRIRRRMREILRKHLSRMAGGFDAVFSARPDLVKATAADIEAKMVDLLKRTRLLA